MPLGSLEDLSSLTSLLSGSTPTLTTLVPENLSLENVIPENLTAPIDPTLDQAPDQVKGIFTATGNEQPVDTGQTTNELNLLPINGADEAEGDPTGADLDVLSAPSSGYPLLMFGVLPEAGGNWTATDIDILSASHGANRLITADLGPDIGPQTFLTVDVLGSNQPLDIQFQGESLTGDLLGSLL